MGGTLSHIHLCRFAIIRHSIEEVGDVENPCEQSLGVVCGFLSSSCRRFRELWALHGESLAFGNKGAGSGRHGGSMASGMAQVTVAAMIEV